VSTPASPEARHRSYATFQRPVHRAVKSGILIVATAIGMFAYQPSSPMSSATCVLPTDVAKQVRGQ